MRRCEGMVEKVAGDGVVSRHGIAPRPALLTGLWGDDRRRKAPAYLFSEAVRTFTGLL